MFNLRSAEWVRWLAGILLVLFLGLLIWSNYRFSVQSPGGNDFLARWTGAHFWLTEGINPYDEQVSLEAQRMIYGRPADPSRGEDIAHFVYPLPAMLFFAPFGLLPYTFARAVWMTILELGLPLLAILGIRLTRWKVHPIMLAGMILFSIFWYHGLRSVIVGQFAVIEAVLIVSALLAIQQKNDPLAGVLLGLSIAKPQMAFLILPYMIIWSLRERRREFVLWIVATIVGLIAISFLIMPDWPILWLRQLVSYPSYTDLGSPISILVSGLARMGTTLTWIISGALAIYMLLEWTLSLGKGEAAFRWTAALTLTITNLIAFRTATTNYVILLPVLIILFHAWSERWGRRGNIMVWVTSFVLLIGLWALFLTTVDGNIEAPIMYLPLPLITLLGLLWSRWWIIRTPLNPDFKSLL
jgi:hypothetical protein